MDFKGKTEKEGLIPVTCKILRNLAKKEDKLEYMNIPVGEVVIVGYSVKYVEQETKIVIGLWDQTGYIEVSFYNKNESETHQGLEGFYFLDKGLVKVVGKVKNYKDNLKIDGARIINTNFNEFFYHKCEVMSDWIYLTNEQSQDDDIHVKDNKKNNNVGLNNMLNSKNQPKEEQIKNICLEVLKYSPQVSISDVLKKVGISEYELVEILKKLSSLGILVYDEDAKEILTI
jgi:RPA family protein